MKTWHYRRTNFAERMELVSEVSSMNTYRYVTHKNDSDSINDVLPEGGNDLRGEVGNVNDIKVKQQHHVHNKYDSGHNSNGVSRYRNNHTLNNSVVNRDLKNEINNDSNSNNTTPVTSNSNHIKFFKTKMCPWHFNGRCVRAQGCSYAHCESELRPVFKTKICDYIADGNCPHGVMCIFAHSSEELKPRLNTGDFQQNPYIYEQHKSKGRQRNANVASPDIQIRENDRVGDHQQQYRDGRVGNNREYYVRHDSSKKMFGNNSNNNSNQYFHYKNKFNHYSKTADEQQRCASSVAARIFDSDSMSSEYRRSTSTMESISDPVFLNCELEKCVCQPASSPSSISDCVIATSFSSTSLNIPLAPSVVSGSLVGSMQADSSCSVSPSYSPSASWALQGPPHLSLSSSGSSPIAIPTFLGGIGGTPSPMAAHYWLQCANTAYISSGNDMLVHHSLYRGGEVPSLRDGSLNVINNSCAQVPSPQIAVHSLSLNSQPSDTLASMSSDENLLMQGSFNASVEELNAARPAFYED